MSNADIKKLQLAVVEIFRLLFFIRDFAKKQVELMPSCTLGENFFETVLEQIEIVLDEFKKLNNMFHEMEQQNKNV
jgi:hypothetical protein